ncbi:MAG: ATP-grasp domain-containing protein [Aureispira sp.]|nr:ATP-grasp domain-containing protein [Aureispira sp.]
MKPLILVIPEKTDEETFAVAKAWEVLGGKVLKLGRFWEPPKLDEYHVRVYGNDTFCNVLAQLLQLNLTAPEDALLAKFDEHYTKRWIGLSFLGQADGLVFPKFVKPAIPKLFQGKVFYTLGELEETTNGLSEDAEVLVSEVVAIEKEMRAFVLNGEVQTMAIYEGRKCVLPSDFVQEFADSYSSVLPVTYVVDFGYNAEIGWFVLELNAVWGAGLNGCDAEKVAKCLEYASS